MENQRETTVMTYADRVIMGIFDNDPDEILVANLARFFKEETEWQKKLPYMEAMNNLGFGQFEEARDHKQAIEQLGYDRTVLHTHLQYRIKYPLCRPFTDEVRTALCQRYNLVIGSASDYTGPLPHWVMKQILQVTIDGKDKAFVYTNPKIEQVGMRVVENFFAGTSNRKAKKMKRNIELALGNEISIRVKQGEIMASPLMVMAPLNFFDTTDKRVINHHLVKVHRSDVLRRIYGMEFHEVISFFEEHPFLVDKGLTAVDAAYDHFSFYRKVSSLESYDDVIDFFKSDPRLTPNGINPEILALRHANYRQFRGRFTNYLGLASYLKQKPELIPVKYEGNAERFAWAIMDPIIFTPVKVGNLALVAFGGPEAFDHALYNDQN